MSQETKIVEAAQRLVRVFETVMYRVDGEDLDTEAYQSMLDDVLDCTDDIIALKQMLREMTQRQTA